MASFQESDHPLRPVVALWLEKLRLARDRKRVEWEKDAIDAFRFFRGPYHFLYQADYLADSPGFTKDVNDPIPAPTFQVSINKVAEACQIFGPVLYHRNPYRLVTPRRVPIPPPESFGDFQDPNVMMFAQQAMQMVQGERGRDKATAQFMEYYLNFTPSKMDLTKHSRLMVDECLITGLGLLWTELYQPPGSKFKYVGSFWDSAFNLQVDPDMNDLDDAQWVARQRVHPTWYVERKFGYPSGTFRGNYESVHAQADVASDMWGLGRRARGETADLMVYWEIYSKMGLGGRLKGCLPALSNVVEQFGDYCYLVVAEGVPYPLNLPSASLGLGMQELMAKVQWPTPYWRMGAWPFARYELHPVPGKLWPMSHFAPAMGELKALNWIVSFVVSKIRTSCRDFVAIAKSASDDFKNKVLHGRDYELLEIERIHETIGNVVQFLQHPGMQPDLWKVIEMLMDLFEKRTGLSELLYGESAHQYRSSAEAKLKGGQLQIRPDDMARQLEGTMSQASALEALTARWHLQPQDLVPVMGQVGAQFWQMNVASADIDTICHGLEYRIEANSTRKPNKDRDRENYEQGMQQLLPLYFQVASAGQVEPFNALVKGWCKSIELDHEEFMLQPPAPPPPMPGAGSQAGPQAGPPPAGAPPAAAAA